MANEKHKKIAIFVSGGLFCLFLGFYMTSQQKDVSTTANIELQESKESKPKMTKVDYDTNVAVEDNFNQLRQYIADTDMLYLSVNDSGFTDGLEQRDLELLKAFEEKGYTIKGSTLFIPFEYSDDVIYYQFDLVGADIDNRVTVTAGYDVVGEQLFSLDYDTDINEVE